MKSQELEKLLGRNGIVGQSVDDCSTDIILDQLCGGENMKYLGDLSDVFKNAIEKLKNHRMTITTKIFELEKQNHKESLKYHDSLKEPEKTLHMISADMDELEDRFTKVSSSAVVIGDRLAVIDKEMNRARETDELLEAILLLNTTSSTAIKSSNKTYSTLKDPIQIHQAFSTVKKLREFAEELTSPSTKNAVQEIERLNQRIETDLLQGFSDVQEQELRGVSNYQDLESMKENANSLLLHGCKEKLADRYVWNIMQEKLTKNHLQVEMTDPTQDLDFLLTKIRAICKSQFVMIQKVFPPAVAPSIRETLVERLFHDPAFGILSHLERLLGGGGSIVPDKDYVGTLTWTYEKCCGLAQSISILPLENDGDKERMNAFLQVQLQVLFGAHRQRYVDIEQVLLSQSFDKTLAMIKWPPIPSGKNRYKLKEQAASQQVTSPKDSKAIASSTPVTTSKPESKPEPLNLFYQMLLPISMDDTMPQKFGNEMKESITRCNIILQNSELRVELMARLFGLFCQAFGEEYLGKMCNLSHELVQEPLLCLDSASNFFIILKGLVGHVGYLDSQYKNVIESYLCDAATQQTICIESKRKTMEKLEGLIAYGLQKTFQAVEKSLVAILTNGQEKGDFMGNHLIQIQSKACNQVIQYLTPLLKRVSIALEGRNRIQFVTNLSSTFKDTYIAHLQKYRFDPDGACLLLTDLAAYRHVFQVCSHPTIDETFDLLHSIANIYALPRDSLVSYVSEGLQVTLGKTTLHALIRRRWDYNINGDKIPI